MTYDVIVISGGQARDHSWIRAEGVHYLGMPQRTRGSALLGWVKHDAERLTAQLYGRSEAGTPPPRVAA